MPISTTEVPESRKFNRQLDPHGKLDYTIDWSSVLDGINNVETTLSPESVAAGLLIDNVHTSDTTTTIRFTVDEQDQDDESFDPPGVDLAFKQNVQDQDGQIWEFTFVVTVVQQ